MSLEQTSLTTTLIGTLIRWPALMDRAVRIVRSPDYFVKQEYRDMYGALLEMYVNGAPISEETYAAELSKKWGGERASIVTYSLGYHSKSETSTPAEFVEWACTTIANRHKLRQIRDLGKKIELQASSTTADPQALLTMMSDAINEVDNQADDAVKIGSIAEEYWEQLISGESDDGYIPTPDPNINHLIGGLYYGDMHMIIGRPSDGKTSLALPIIRHAAKLNKRGIYFALDETKRSMLQRCISMDTGLSRGDMRKSVMNEEKPPGTQRL